MHYLVYFDFEKMTLTLIDPYDYEKTISITYNIGDNLIAFLNCDLINYDKNLKDTIKKLMTKEYLKKTELEFKEHRLGLYEVYKESKYKDFFEKDIKNTAYNHLLLEICKNPNYPKYSNLVFYSNTLKTSGENLKKLLDYQSCLRDVINFCYNLNDSDLLSALDIHQRFFLYREIGEYRYFLDEISIPSNITPVVNNVSARTNNYLKTLDKAMFKNYGSDGDELIPNELNDKIISLVKKLDIKTCEHYRSDNHISMFCLEFTKILVNNLTIKKCKNCNKYFLLKDNYKTDYCNNIPDGETKSCKEIGAVRKYAEKVKNDPILEAYNRAYKTHFARIRYGKMTKEEFNKWTLTATDMKNKTKSGTMGLEDFKKWLKK